MSKFYFIRFSHCGLHPVFINVSKSVFHDLSEDYELFFHDMKHVSADSFIQSVSEDFKSLHVLLMPSMYSDSDLISYYDIFGFELTTYEDANYHFLFDFTTFPDGSGLPEEVGHVVKQLEKEYGYNG